MITPLIDTMKTWIPCVTHEDYHRPISVVTAVACAALAIFVSEAEIVSLFCGAITVCTLAVVYKVSMIALSYFVTEPVAENPAPTQDLGELDATAPALRPESPREGNDFVKVSPRLFKPLGQEPK